MVTGRYSEKAVDRRLCKLCYECGCVEDEFHFLMICKTYQQQRDEFFTKINTFIVPFETLTREEQFIFLLSTNDTEILT